MLSFKKINVVVVHANIFDILINTSCILNLSLKLKSTSAIFVRTKAALYNAQIRQDYYNANEEKKDSILQNVFRKIQKKADLKK